MRLILSMALAAALAAPQSAKPRARDLGVPFEGTPGALNAITDVAGIEVGLVTLIRGEGPLVVGTGPVRTGVTAILPRGRASNDPVMAGWFSLNGNGEMTGTTWIKESGFLEGPVFITNTHSVGVVRDASIAWSLEHGGTHQPWALPVVAETYDGTLNDIDGFHVKPEHVFQALDGAKGGPVAEGGVGGGTGMMCYQFKCGTGTASRRLDAAAGGYTVGVLVQANHGRRPQLIVDGVPMGREVPELMPERGEVRSKSILLVVATDAPLLPAQLQRLAKRTGLGLARTGALSMHSSGDLALAFSTANRLPARSAARVEALEVLDDEAITPLYQATIEATEEAVLNALTSATTMTGRDGNRVHALPLDRLVEVMRRYGRMK